MGSIFMVSGHCYLEMDSIFACVESKSATFNIFAPKEETIVGNVNKNLYGYTF